MTAYNFETPPSPILESAITEVIEADVVVAGAGPSGLAAAVSAAQAGAVVVLIEKFHRISAPGGPGAPFIDSRLQKERAARGTDAPPPNARMMPPASAGLPPLPGTMGPMPELPGGPPPVGPPVGGSECGPVPTKEEMVEGLWKASDGRADERLIKLWADRSGEVADWLVDMANEQGIDVMVGRFSHMFCKPADSTRKGRH